MRRSSPDTIASLQRKNCPEFPRYEKAVTVSQTSNKDAVLQYMRYFITNEVTSTQFLNALALFGTDSSLRAVAPNLLPALVTKPSMNYMIQAAESVAPSGVSTEFGRLDYGFSLIGRKGLYLGSPLDLTWSNYSLTEDSTMRLFGPMIVSFNHRIMANKEFGEEYKRMSLAVELFAYLVRHQGLVLGVPKRASGSLTDRLLREYNPTVKDIPMQENKIHSLYFITWNGVPAALKQWFFAQNHPMVESAKKELQLSQDMVTWSDPSRNMFDLGAEWMEEYVLEAQSESYIEYFIALLRAQQELFSTLLPTWLTVYSSRVGDSQDWTEWMLAHLTGTSPLQLEIQAEELEKNELNLEAQKLLAKRSFYTG